MLSRIDSSTRFTCFIFLITRRFNMNISLPVEAESPHPKLSRYHTAYTYDNTFLAKRAAVKENPNAREWANSVAAAFVTVATSSVILLFFYLCWFTPMGMGWCGRRLSSHSIRLRSREKHRTPAPAGGFAMELP